MRGLHSQAASPPSPVRKRSPTLFNLTTPALFARAISPGVAAVAQLTDCTPLALQLAPLSRPQNPAEQCRSPPRATTALSGPVCPCVDRVSEPRSHPVRPHLHPNTTDGSSNIYRLSIENLKGVAALNMNYNNLDSTTATTTTNKNKNKNNNSQDINSSTSTASITTNLKYLEAGLFRKGRALPPPLLFMLVRNDRGR